MLEFVADRPLEFAPGSRFKYSNSDDSRVVAAGWTWAAGGMVSTPAELTRFIRGYVGGRLFGGRVRADQLCTATRATSSDTPSSRPRPSTGRGRRR